MQHEAPQSRGAQLAPGEMHSASLKHPPWSTTVPL
jgi:hypothetical protein